ncbi:hypothetical protein [Asanoa siamensis]|uniref:Uncharacterized protein n=1 Tax=Asanoa siamensis TaxID=926357 RepID=A0ABQ4CST2_9ACTN|nr:hypothetical protein [Asanoa siamensis]GIF73912.1 hypothetical protein Asi02nite_34300 [Asanoa siamensis]
MRRLTRSVLALTVAAAALSGCADGPGPTARHEARPAAETAAEARDLVRAAIAEMAATSFAYRSTSSEPGRESLADLAGFPNIGQLDATLVRDAGATAVPLTVSLDPAGRITVLVVDVPGNRLETRFSEFDDVAAPAPPAD